MSILRLMFMNIEESKKYPKILLLGHSFNNFSGMGVTLTNLFAEWPKENIAVCASSIDIDLCEEIRPCAKYIGKSTDSRNVLYQKKEPKLKDSFRKYLRKIYYKFGLHEICVSKTISDSDYKQIVEYNPEIVFCALGSYVAMKRCENLINLLPDSKLVLYIVDDWVNTKVSSRYFSPIWKHIYDKKFRQLLDRASGQLSICQYMSDEYLKQYGKVFIPFHNPVDLTKWEEICPVAKYSADIISIAYMGKINEDTYPCLMNLSNVVQDLNSKGFNYVLDIYSPDYSSKAYLFDCYVGTTIYPPIPHKDVGKVFKSYTALFLPLGFSKQSRTYVRLSMPTKLSEYLASCRPILLNCPKEIALSKYLSDKKCAILCVDDSLESLRNATLQLNDKENYKELIYNSHKLACVHDIRVVREQFRGTLSKF